MKTTFIKKYKDFVIGNFSIKNYHMLVFKNNFYNNFFINVIINYYYFFYFIINHNSNYHSIKKNYNFEQKYFLLYLKLLAIFSQQEKLISSKAKITSLSYKNKFTFLYKTSFKK
jgi:hypothetical protein